MAEILTSVGTFFTQVVTWMGDLLTFIVGEPVLLLMVICLPIAGAAIGYLNRLIRL